MRKFSFVLGAACVFATSPANTQQVPQPPADFDMRVSAALRNDLAGTLIKLGQAGLCDVACHLVLARALVALDTATPVVMAPQKAPEEPHD